MAHALEGSRLGVLPTCLGSGCGGLWKSAVRQIRVYLTYLGSIPWAANLLGGRI